MGLGYFILFLAIIGGAAWTVLLFKLAWETWHRPRRRWFAIVSLALGLFCAYWALFALYIVWREPPWLFF